MAADSVARSAALHALSLYAYLLERSPLSIECWYICDRFISANLPEVGENARYLYSNVIIDMYIDVSGNVRSLSNISVINLWGMRGEVTTVMVNIPVNRSGAVGHELYELILPQLKALCGGSNVEHELTHLDDYGFHPDAAVAIEVIISTFPNVKSIFFEIQLPQSLAQAPRNTVFSYGVLQIPCIITPFNVDLLTFYVTECFGRITEAYNDEPRVYAMGAMFLDTLYKRDCSYGAAAVPWTEPCKPSAASDYFRHLLYYPLMQIARLQGIVRYGLFQVIT
ncbi:hypothetical protein GGF46_004481 [Coemansia sp. RSA 552]|nr:hypothetical protein GGF46_004481 [Coemansia sp. RSA 552]